MENLIKPEFGLTFWTISIFFILVLLLGRFVWKPMLKAVDERERKIIKDIQEAQKAREEAQRIKDEIEAKFKNVDKEISAKMSMAIYNANIEKEKIISRAQTQAEIIINNAKKEIENYKNSVEKELEGKIVEISSLITKKVLGEIVDKKLDEKILESTLKACKNNRN